MTQRPNKAAQPLRSVEAEAGRRKTTQRTLEKQPSEAGNPDAEAGERYRRQPAGSQTVDRALGLIQLVAAAPTQGYRLSELAGAAGLDRATAYRLLVSLTNHGFLEQSEDTKRYKLGLEFFALAATASNSIDLGKVAREALQAVASKTGDTATFCVRSGVNLVCVDVESGNFPIRTLPMDIGSHRPLGAGASGIAVLAALPDFEIEALLKKSARRLEEVPGQDHDTIIAAIAECRARGFALAADEPLGRIIGLSVALLNRRGRPQSTLTLNGIPERFSTERLHALVETVTRSARAIEDAMHRMPDNARHRKIWMKDAADPGGLRQSPLSNVNGDR